MAKLPWYLKQDDMYKKDGKIHVNIKVNKLYVLYCLFASFFNKK